LNAHRLTLLSVLLTLLTAGGRIRSETGGIQELAVQSVGLQPSPRLTPFLSMLTVKTEPVYPRAVEP